MKDEFTSHRAKQFAPFAALKGFEEALALKTAIAEDRQLLGEDAAAELNERLCRLTKGCDVSIRYYSGGRTQTISGKIERIDEAERLIKLNGRCIAISDIVYIETA